MFVANLPIAGNQPQNLLIEYKQRAQEFWALDKALASGELPDAQKALLLQQNITNPIQTIQKYLQFGYDQQTAEQLLLLAIALQTGDLDTAEAARANLKKMVRKRHVLSTPADSAEPRDDAPNPIPDRPKSSGRGLNTLA